MKEGSARYKALLDEALQLHLNKNQGYAADNPDAFANFRLAEGMGLTPLQGVMVRLGDKFARAQSLMRNPDNDKVGESLRDTLMDLSAYALIGICLMEEATDDFSDGQHDPRDLTKKLPSGMPPYVTCFFVKVPHRQRAACLGPIEPVDLWGC